MSTLAPTVMPSDSEITSALDALNAALATLTDPTILAVPTTAVASVAKLFELRVALHVLSSLPYAADKWRCSTGPKLVLQPGQHELELATTFARHGTSDAVALNVRVHYPGSPGFKGARHEADVAIFHSSQLKASHLHHIYVREVFEAKYRKWVPKSVLRELAFIATQLPAALGPYGRRVVLTVAKGVPPWSRTPPPSYWSDAERHYKVSCEYVSFP